MIAKNEIPKLIEAVNIKDLYYPFSLVPDGHIDFFFTDEAFFADQVFLPGGGGTKVRFKKRSTSSGPTLRNGRHAEQLSDMPSVPLIVPKKSKDSDLHDPKIPNVQ